jgi:hypothetical protein
VRFEKYDYMFLHHYCAIINLILLCYYKFIVLYFLFHNVLSSVSALSAGHWTQMTHKKRRFIPQCTYDDTGK